MTGVQNKTRDFGNSQNNSVITLNSGEVSKLNFTRDAIETLQLHKDGSLTIVFKDGGSLTIENYKALVEKGMAPELMDGKALAIKSGMIDVVTELFEGQLGGTFAQIAPDALESNDNTIDALAEDLAKTEPGAGENTNSTPKSEGSSFNNSFELTNLNADDPTGGLGNTTLQSKQPKLEEPKNFSNEDLQKPGLEIGVPENGLHAFVVKEDGSVDVPFKAINNGDGDVFLTVNVTNIPQGWGISSTQGMVNTSNGTVSYIGQGGKNIFDTITLTPPADSDADIHQLKFEVKATDTQTNETSVKTGTTKVITDAVVDGVDNFDISSPGGEGGNDVPLNISGELSDTDGSETLHFIIKGVPQDAPLNAGENLGNGKWKVTSEEIEGLALQPSNYFDQSFDLTVKAIVEESNLSGQEIDLSDNKTKQTETIHLNIDPQNKGPQAQDDNASTDEDSAVNINVLDNDSDPEGDPLIITGTTNPANGTVNVNNDGTVTYTPDEDFNGDDSFEYTIEDSESGETDTATVTVHVNAVNDAPVAHDDNANTSEDTPVTINVLGNDSDPDGDQISVITTTAPPNGNVTVNNDGTVTYTPAPDFNGDDSFTYTIADEGGLTDTATVTVHVGAVNDAPVANNDSFNGQEETAVNGNVLTNDSDPDGDDITVTQITQQPSNGTVTIDANGEFTYTPAQDFFGDDSFVYEITDGNGGFDEATVSIHLADVPENAPPEAIDDNYNMDEDTQLTDNVLTNDSDPDGDDITVTQITQQPSNGTVTIDANGDFTYTPAQDFFGDDSFAYEITDGNGGFDEATVSIHLADVPENAPPEAKDDYYSMDEDTQLTDNVLTNDSDPDGDDITVTQITQQPSNGTVTIDANGDFTYTPDADYAGPDSFRYQITDGNGGFDEAHVCIYVIDTPENLPPVANNDHFEGTEHQQVNENVLVNDSDPDGDNITVTNVTQQPSNGTVTIDANGDFTYTPDAGFTGQDTFTYEITDGNGGVDTADVKITVKPEPDLGEPEIGQKFVKVDETNLDSGPLTVHNTVPHDFGPDGKGSIMPSGSFTATYQVGGQDQTLTSNGQTINVSATANGYIGTAGGQTIFTLDVDPHTGQYDYKQFEAIDHPDTHDPDDVIWLKFGVKITDKDGDTDTGIIGIDVHDDAPDAKDDHVEVKHKQVSGNVLNNDDLSNDTPNTVIQVNGQNIDADGEDIVGQFGTLHISSDGSYTYTANPHAHKTTYHYSRNNPPGSDEAGDIKNVKADYNPDTEELSFEMTVEPSADGFTMAINDGPNPIGHGGELALFYFDATDPNNPVVTTYAYNGLNTQTSWQDGSAAEGTQAPDKIVSSLNENSPFGSITVNTDAHGNKVFGFTVDATSINNHHPLYGVEGEWTGAQFAEKLGIWLHAVDGLHTSYSHDGYLTEWSIHEKSWYDVANQHTEKKESGGAKGNDVFLSFDEETLDFPELTEGHQISGSTLNNLGIAKDALEVDTNATVNVKFVSEGAGFDNTFGGFAIASDGTLVNAAVLIENGNDLNGNTEFSYPIGAGQSAGFFIIADGADVNNDYQGIDFSNGQLEFVYKLGTAQERAANISDNGGDISLVYTDNATQHQIALNGPIYFTSERGSSDNLNADHSVRVVSGLADGDHNTLRIGFEDLPNLGDKDYEDIVFDVQIQTHVSGDMHDEFEYVLKDADGDKDTATLKFKVEKQKTNLPPDAKNDHYKVFELDASEYDANPGDTSISESWHHHRYLTGEDGDTFQLEGGATVFKDTGSDDGGFWYKLPVLNNDHDPDGDHLTITGIHNVKGLPHAASLHIDHSGQFIVMKVGQDLNFKNSTVTFDYTVEDKHGATDKAHVKVIIDDKNSPLVLDLDGDGVEIVHAENSDAMFDLDLDGEADDTGWISGDDGFLALDINGDGIINDKTELFGDNQGFANGFEQLATLDTNQDGIIDSTDDKFRDLQIWQDKNEDGQTDQGELNSLDHHGIASIDLNADIVNKNINGQLITHESTFTKIDGSVDSIEDVWFSEFGDESLQSVIELGSGQSAGGVNGQKDTFKLTGEFNEASVIQNFSTEDGDAVEISSILEDIETDADLTDYLSAKNENGDLVINTHQSGDHQETALVTLQGHGNTDLDSLIDNGNLF